MALQMWYLTEELIQLGLFSNFLSIETNDSIRILCLKQKHLYVKKSFKDMVTVMASLVFQSTLKTRVTDLPMFAGTGCWKLFSILGISSEFFFIPCYEMERFTII